MIESKKVSQQIADYVLDLLPPFERKQVEENAAKNKAYHQTLQQERQIGQIVRASLQQTTTPDSKRLRQLMPEIPQKKRPFLLINNTWHKQLTAIAVLAIFFLGSFSIYQSQQNPIYSSPPTLTAATATFTNEPTATQNNTATSTAVAKQTEEKMATPEPGGTPVAAILPTMN